MTALLAAEVPDFLLTPLKLLALIGCAALGGWALGWVASMTAKLYFSQKIPPWPMWFIRTLGFVACGLLAYYWLFGGGSGGFGWGSGGDSGTGKDGTIIKKDESVRKDKDKEKAKDGKKKDGEKTPPDQTLHVEVLGDAPLKKLQVPVSGGKRYRVEGSSELYTLEELKALIQKRRSAKPPLSAVEIILYNDSPSESSGLFKQLENWVIGVMTKHAIKLSVRPGSEAPVN